MTEATLCTIETKPQVWDLGGTMKVDIANVSNPDQPLGMVHEGEDLKVTVTVKLTGHIRHYLCDTKLCVCLGFESCGSGDECEFCEWITLEGEYDPCQTDTFVFTFDLPGDALKAGPCGREYDICITLGSRDCCDKVGFIFGSCRGFSITVLPAIQADAAG